MLNGFRRTSEKYFGVLASSPIIAGLVGASFGLVLSNLAAARGAGPPQWALVGIFLAAIFSAAFVQNKLTSVEVRVAQLTNAAHLLRVDEQSGGMDIVNGLVQNSRIVRVVGRARQDQLMSPLSHQKDYLAATEAAVRTGRLRVYRRITGDELRTLFRGHLERLLRMRQPGQDVQVALVPEIDLLVSYQVFDRTAAIIGIETSAVPGIRDSTVVFLTYNVEIIDALTAHFDGAWARLTAIADADELLSRTTAL
ncbi:hypothetical protein IMZ11_39565 [Microtetraspora sp. AC03309]|uniref:hypothetical protein n=1 Tax=Microtetraspora sp. AC03309 TaxID=2779376 RepID=UPI001E33A317|nr:hypothetical protein [Microtetraspora sp. AC03309]MCC5581718.1 hypothetical protein [Microtetraspora sp. AC03309]